MHRRLKFVLGGGGIVLAVSYLVSTATLDSATYYLTVSEAAESAHGGATVRVKGKVQGGSIARHAEEPRLAFVLSDSRQQLRVRYDGLLPDLFSDGREVIVEGRLDGGELRAQAILASCPSKYDSPDGAAPARDR
ncbi:MAG: cytochrome c maturation protein CcmE [Deltaproteobacteria bacterium]|nr:cytochrome c maturation protein CcmE [Deltaproteobacteria bacterium]